MENPAPRHERYNQVLLEKILIPKILLQLPNTEATQDFVATTLSSALQSTQYRFEVSDKDSPTILLNLVRIDGYNVRENEPTPQEAEYMTPEQMISVQDVYARLSDAIYQFCKKANPETPAPPVFHEYTQSPLSRGINLPKHILEIREHLATLIDWSELRSLPVGQMNTEAVEVHLEEMERHYNRFFNTQGSAAQPSFYDWLHEVNPVLREKIGVQQRNSTPKNPSDAGQITAP